MMTIRKANERWHSNHGWIDSYHTFGFEGHFDKNWMGFRNLRIINDDLLMPGHGFGFHPHRNMEIITYVLSGEVEHKDSMGNRKVIRAGEIQCMSAGSGVEHSEYNASHEEALRFLQIWILPESKGGTPRYGQMSLEARPTGQLHLVASRSGRNGSTAIRQDADLWLAKLEKGQSVLHSLQPARAVWLQVVEGEIVFNGKVLASGDGVASEKETKLQISAVRQSQVLLFDLN
jgi:redox-sensitive bicupin YhaK (pirin superfamily)